MQRACSLGWMSTRRRYRSRSRSHRGSVARHRGTILHRPDHIRKLVEKLGVICISTMRPDRAAMACAPSLLNWDMTESWLPFTYLCGVRAIR